MFYTSLGLYACLILFLAYWIGRHDSRENFLIAGRNRGVWQIAASKLGGNIGAGWFLAYTAFGFQYGLAVYYALAVYALGYILFAWLAVPRIWRWGQQTQAFTLRDLIAQRTGDAFAARFVGYMVVLTHAAWLLVAFTGGPKIMASLGFPGGYVGSVVAMAGFTLVYLLLSGLRGVVMTDVVQAAVIVLFGAGIGYYALSAPEITEAFRQATNELPVTLIIAFVLFGLSFVFNADRYQLIFASRSVRSAQWGMAFPIVMILLLAFALVAIGLQVRLMSPASDPDIAFLTFLQSALPPIGLTFGILLFVAAVMSTIDSIVFAVASHAVDLQSSQHPRRTLRLALTVTVVWVAIFAYLLPDVVGASILSIAMLMIGTPGMLYFLCGGTRASSLYASFGAGLAGFVAGYALLGPTPPLIVIIFTMALVGLLCAQALIACSRHKKMVGKRY